MAQIAIKTDDRRLYRILSILVEECGHSVGDHAPALLITDRKDPPSHFDSLPLLKIGEGGISRPFSHARLKEEIASRLRADALPLLTPTEKRLFDALRAASPAPVAREDLEKAAFGDDCDDGMLNLYVHYLRKKLEADGKKRIFAARGKGYFYVDDTFR